MIMEMSDVSTAPRYYQLRQEQGTKLSTLSINLLEDLVMEII